MLEPNITRGQIAIDPRNGVLFYKDGSGNLMKTTLSFNQDTYTNVSTDDTVTFSNNVVIDGNLTVNGDTVTVNVSQLSIEDNILILNSNVTGTPTQNAGIEIERGNLPNVSIRWNESAESWEYTNDGIEYNTIGSGGGGGSSESINDIGDVVTTTAANGEYLKYDGTYWRNATITLGTNTSGNYVQSLVAGTGVTLSNNSGEGSQPTIAIGQNVSTGATPTFGRVIAPLTGNVTGNVTGNLTGNVTGTVSDISNHSINALSDVTISGQANGDFLRYQSGNWINDAVNLSTDTVGDYVSTLTEGTGISVTNTGGEGATPNIALDAVLDNLNDVVVSNATPGQVLKYNGTNWINDTDNTGTTIESIDDIDDASIDTPLPYQGLMYNGTNWVNSNIPNTYLVRNNTGSTLLKGTLVSASGAQPSGRIDVEPHQTTGLQDSELRVMGIVTANISDGVNGEVMSFGTLVNIDTRGNVASALAVGDETWAAGDILYAHPTTAGKLTNVRPTHDLAVAFITIRHASSGQIAIRIIPGNNHLEWQHDVSLTSPASGDFLKYNGSIWVNDPINLGTDTTGSYIQSLVAGTGVTVSNNSGEGTTPTISIGQDVSTGATPSFNRVFADITGDVTGTVSDVSNHQINDLNDVVTVLEIGDTGPAGGKIFITPNTAGNTTGKYFEAAPYGSSVIRPWATNVNNNQTTAVLGADATAIGTGEQNTIDIVAQSGNVAATCAAAYASDYTYGGFSDWFLPSRNELTELYTHRESIGGFVADNYWSSSENFSFTAWFRSFDTGIENHGNKDISTASNPPYVRPVRSFTVPALSSGQVLQYNGTVWVNKSIDLGTDTNGNYVKSLVAGTGISISNNSGEGATPNISLNASLNDLTDATMTGATPNQVLAYNGTAWTNTTVGDYWNKVNGNSNASYGPSALSLANSTSYYNVGIGEGSLASLTEGDNNIAIGYNTLNKVVDAEENIAIGKSALSKVTGNYNIAIGGGALFSYNNLWAGSVAIGHQSALSTTGLGTTSVGYSTLRSNTTGEYHCAFGYNALNSNTTGTTNVAFGALSSEFNTTGSCNTAIGVGALRTNVSGSYNVAIGYYAGIDETGSNKLYIANSSTSNPLIYGDFSTSLLRVNGSLEVTSSLSLTGSSGIIFEGATPNAHETTLNVVEPTADRTILLPNASTTLVGTDTTDTLTNKTITDAGPISILQSSNHSSYPLTISSANEQGGGSGFSDILKIVNSKSGATNINKHLRMNSFGTLEMINSAYTASIFSVSDDGTVTSTNLGETGWTTVGSFSNSFVSGGNDPGYRRLNNVVYLRGNINSGTAGQTAFTLPSGYRPATDFVIPVQQFGTGSITYVTIYTDGRVVPNSTSGWLTGVNFPIG